MTVPFYTLKGKKLDLQRVLPEEIDIEEIANALANQGRYNGQTKKFYSVAEHCVLLAQYGQQHGFVQTVQKQLLLHDATEAYVGDLVYHLKRAIPMFHSYEFPLWQAVAQRFAIPWQMSDEIHELDRRICMDEMTQLMTTPDDFQNLLPLGIDIQCWSPEKARKEYLKQAKRLAIK